MRIQKTQRIDVNAVFYIKQKVNYESMMYAKCIFILLVTLFPITLLTELKQLGFNEPKVKNSYFNSPVNSKYKT